MPNTIHQELVQVLRASTAFVALAADIYPEVIPQSVTARPACRYSIISADPDSTLETSGGLVFYRLQIDCFSPNFKEATDLAEAVKAALIANSGGSGVVKAWIWEGESSDFEGDLDATAGKVYRVMLEFRAIYRP